MLRTLVSFTWILLLIVPCYGQKKQLFDFNEGLSNSLINQVYQDHIGFIWVATEDGLNRFDGVKFKSFSGNKGKPSSLKANFVTSLFEDKEGHIWVGQVNGLQYYNPGTESFDEIQIFINNEQIFPFVSDITQVENGDIWVTTSRYGLLKIDHKIKRPYYSTRLNEQLCSFYLECIFKDSKGVLWIGSDNNGLSIYDPHTGNIQNFSSKKQDNQHFIPFNDITDICEDPSGNIFVGTLKGGLLRFNSQNSTWTSIKTPNKQSLPVKTLLVDGKNRLWVGTDGKGLWQLKPDKGMLEQMHPGSSSFDFSKSKIHSIIEDNAGNIWLGIFQKGLYLFPETPDMFYHYGYKAFGDNSIGSSSINAVSGHKNDLWIGTDGDGVYYMDRSTKKVKAVVLNNADGKSEGSNVLSLYDSKDGYVWIGTFFNGLLRYNTQSGKVKTYRNNPADPKSIPNDKITSIHSGKNETLYLTTLGGGISRLHMPSEHFSNGLELADSLNKMIPKWTNDIYIDSLKRVWIATYDGLVLANIQKNEVEVFTTENDFLPNNVVYCVFGDRAQNIWVGTYEGLVKIEPNTMQRSIYTTKNGLGSNVICGIQEDEFNQIWISTHNGLSRYNPLDSVFTTYYASDGLQANEFSRNAAFRTDKKELLFCGINGITEIKKDYIHYNRSVRDVMLTDFSLYNQPVEMGDKSGKHEILNRSIVLADTVKLMERDNIFSIGFTSVELAKQSSISYEYMMEGFDEKWNRNNLLSRMATYTNLKHGEYRFKVRGVDKNQYSAARTLTIIIYPPWYKTKLAKITWLLLAFAFFYGIVLFNREKVKRREAEKINEKKMQFFINISHEIKTPLSLIIDPLEKLLHKKNSEESQRLYRTMNINANRIFRLVSQLLDVRKIDKGQLLIKFQKIKICSFVHEVAETYKLIAEQKNMHFEIHCEPEVTSVWIDPLNFEKIILNLLSNAFKYTPEGGSVSIQISQTILNKRDKKQATHLQIVVSDTGIGIKKDEREKVFERFYQGSSAENRGNTGTGIGMHLSRSLVELHKGQLFAEPNAEGNGTRFILQIPLGNQHLSDKDIICDENISVNISTQNKGMDEQILQEKNVLVKPQTTYKVMVVDDEEEIRNYLSYELSSLYTVQSCNNGAEAWDVVNSHAPDLIVSDIMMPEMDGISLCKKIKSNIKTSHIPIILLTALSKEEDRAEGIDTGADMYFSKPFNSELLKKTIANLLENRRKILQQLVRDNENHVVETLPMKSQDEILIKKVMKIVKENISDNNLNVEMLAEGVGISRVHMHRKLKELTNQSARDFIKNIRMKQATYLLTTKNMNISEVAYAVGYSNLSHFSNSFKTYFGISPKEYMSKNTQV